MVEIKHFVGHHRNILWGNILWGTIATFEHVRKILNGGINRFDNVLIEIGCNRLYFTQLYFAT